VALLLHRRVAALLRGRVVLLHGRVAALRIVRLLPVLRLRGWGVVLLRRAWRGAARIHRRQSDGRRVNRSARDGKTRHLTGPQPWDGPRIRERPYSAVLPVVVLRLHVVYVHGVLVPPLFN